MSEICSDRKIFASECLDLPLEAKLPTVSCSPQRVLSGLLEIVVPVRLRRRGVEARLVVGTVQPEPDPVLVRTLAEAHHWAAELRCGTPLGEIARSAGRDEAVIRKRIRLAFLAPKIQRAIIEGTLAPELTLRKILPLRIPQDWEDQARLFGF